MSYVKYREATSEDPKFALKTQKTILSEDGFKDEAKAGSAIDDPEPFS